MTKSLMTAGATLLFTIALAACGHKAPPASTTTTRTQTTTENSQGDTSKTDVKETHIEHADGSQEVQTTTKTNAVTPPTMTPAPAPK